MSNTREDENVHILPIVYPSITTYTQHAHTMSILEAYDYTKDWIMSHYIMIFCRKKCIEKSWGDFYFPATYELRGFDHCRYLLTQKVLMETIQHDGFDMIDFVCDSIDRGNYIHIMLDNFYIDKSQRFYQKEHKNHDTLIYGYDKNQEILYAADFAYSTSQKYTFVEIKFDQFRLAQKNADLHYDITTDYLNGIFMMYKILPPEAARYDYHFYNIINQLKAYYNCTEPDDWKYIHNDDRKCCVFGLECYDALIQYLNDLRDDTPMIDIRIYTLMSDHKHLMCQRIEFLKEQKSELTPILDPLLESYQEVDRLCGCVPFLFVKMALTKQKKYANRAIDTLQQAKELETKALGTFLKEFDEKYVDHFYDI